MGNPYSQPTLTGYNASPPADDGTAVAANALKWSSHINKIGDPLKTFAQAVDTNILAAFGLIFGNTISTHSSAHTVVAADRGKFLEVTGTTTITLLPVATAGDGFPLLIVNTGTAVVTVDGATSETINGATTITVNPKDALLITCDGSKWVGTLIPTPDRGSFTANWTGFTTAQETTINYSRVGNIVCMHLNPGINATSNATSMASGVSEVPAHIIPDTTRTTVIGVRDNGTVQFGEIRVATNGQISFGVGAAGGNFTGSGGKGFESNTTLTYYIDAP